MEDRLLLAEGRAAAAERAALEAARAAELASRRVHDMTGDLARASAEVGDSRGRHDAALVMQQQVCNSCSARVVTTPSCASLHAV
jgi:ferritin-like protein